MTSGPARDERAGHPWRGPAPGGVPPGIVTRRAHARRRAVRDRGGTVEAVTSPDPDSTVRPVDYKGEPLDAERGPGLGCFRFQLVMLAGAIILTPLSVAWNWPSAFSAALLFLTIFLLLFAGQTIIFLLRLVAADRRDGRRRPLASGSPTVGELEDRQAGDDATAADVTPAAPATAEATAEATVATAEATAATADATPDMPADAPAAKDAAEVTADDAGPGSPGVRE